MDFKHSSRQCLNINIRLFKFDVSIEITKIFRLHIHAFKYSDEPENCKLLIVFIHIIVDGELLLHFAFYSIYS